MQLWKLKNLDTMLFDTLIILIVVLLDINIETNTCRF